MKESKEWKEKKKKRKQKHKFLTRLRPFHSIFVQIVLVLIDKSSFSAMVFGYVLLMEQTTSQNTNEQFYIFTSFLVIPYYNGEKLFNKWDEQIFLLFFIWQTNFTFLVILFIDFYDYCIKWTNKIQFVQDEL